MRFSHWFGDSDASMADLRRRVAVLEAQVAELSRVAGVDLTRLPVAPPVSDRVRDLALAGKQIEAIKVHREETGLSLLEAKADVDQVRRG